LDISIVFQISEAACNPAYLRPLLEALVEGLTAEPRVASNVCWAFSSLAEAAYEAAESDTEETPATYCLSAFFDPIVQKLLETTGKVLVFKDIERWSFGLVQAGPDVIELFTSVIYEYS